MCDKHREWDRASQAPGRSWARQPPRTHHQARTDERRHSRNGYRVRPSETRLGSLDLQIPKLREGSYLPSFINPRRLLEKASVSADTQVQAFGER